MKQAVTALLALLCAAPASANSPEPSDKDIARAAQTCTAEGAFGLHFGLPAPTRILTTDVVPFRIMEWAEADGYGVSEIVGNASFAKAPMSQEDRIALADWYIGKLDTEITDTRKPAKREHRAIVGRDLPGHLTGNDTVTYTFKDFTLELIHAGVQVNLVCTDTRRKFRP